MSNCNENKNDNEKTDHINKTQALREKYPNAEFFLVRIFPHSDWIRRDTPNSEYPEKTPYLDTFTGECFKDIINLEISSFQNFL